MKRTIEYTREFRDTNMSEAAWFNKMADSRWELVTSDGPSTYIFRRPIQDRFLAELSSYVEDIRLVSDMSPMDEYERGKLMGLTSAYSMYVNWGD